MAEKPARAGSAQISGDFECHWSPTGFQKTSFGRSVARSSPGSAQERPGAIHIYFTRVLAIPVAQGAPRRDGQHSRGKPVLGSEATKRSKLRYFDVFVNLMIFGAPLSVSDTLQCVSQTRPQWGPVGILVVGVSSRGVVLQNASCTRMGRARGG